MNWYVLKSRREIDTRDRLADFGFYAHVPQETVQRRVGRRLQDVERPLWRGYVFVLCRPEDLCVVGAAGEGFVCYLADVEAAGETFAALRPIALALHLLDPILLAEAVGELDFTPTGYTPQRGDKVRVGSGKWKGFLGRIISVGKREAVLEPDAGPGRLKVDMTTLEKAA